MSCKGQTCIYTLKRIIEKAVLLDEERRIWSVFLNKYICDQNQTSSLCCITVVRIRCLAQFLFKPNSLCFLCCWFRFLIDLKDLIWPLAENVLTALLKACDIVLFTLSTLIGADLMYRLGQQELNFSECLRRFIHHYSLFSDRTTPVNMSKWWSTAILLLGLTIGNGDERPNKEVFGPLPNRPLVRFRHKVLISFFFWEFAVLNKRSTVCA